MNALDRTDIAPGSKNLAVGDGLSSTCMQKSYLSRRTTIDIQGLVMKGHERKSAIMAHGLRQLTAKNLACTSLPDKSSMRRVDLMPVMQKHRGAADEADNAYKAAIATVMQDAAQLEHLRKQRQMLRSRMWNVRAHLYEKELDALAEQAQQQLELDALLGEGPAAAKKALISHVAPRSTDDDDEEKEERLLTQQDAVEEASLQQSEGWQRCSQLLDSMLADDDCGRGDQDI